MRDGKNVFGLFMLLTLAVAIGVAVAPYVIPFASTAVLVGLAIILEHKSGFAAVVVALLAIAALVHAWPFVVRQWHAGRKAYRGE